jgi:hypothetical protein
VKLVFIVLLLIVFPISLISVDSYQDKELIMKPNHDPIQSNSNPVSFVNIPLSAPKEDLIITINLYIDSTFADWVNFDHIINTYDNNVFSSNQHFVGNRIVQVNVIDITEEDHNSIIQFLHAIEDNQTHNGHSFNTTAFDQGKRNQVFTNETGKAYDAELTLDHIADNLWNQKMNEYSLFVFNFTQLSGLDTDHWFIVKPEDIDSGKYAHGFFTGTTGLINGKQVSAWGGSDRRPLYFIDLASKVWFGDFINHVWPSGYFDNTIRRNINSPISQEDKITWINNYINQFFALVFLEPILPSVPTGYEIEVPNIVFYNWSSYNITLEDSKWIINDNTVEENLGDAYEWMNFHFESEWFNLHEFPDIMTEMKKYMNFIPEEGIYLLEIKQGFFNYVKDIIVPIFVPESSGDVNLPSVVFLLDNTIFTLDQDRIAGVSWQGIQLQGITPTRTYDVNGQADRGLSQVLIHEIGHSLGLPHPFVPSDGWAPDFTASVMGYYTSWPEFSNSDINRLGRPHASQFLTKANYIAKTSDHDNLNFKEGIQRMELGKYALEEWDFYQAVTLFKESLCYFAHSYYASDDRICSMLPEPITPFDMEDKSTTEVNTTTKNQTESDDGEFSIPLPIPVFQNILLLMLPLFLSTRLKMKFLRSERTPINSDRI